MTGVFADGLAAVRDPSWANLGLLGLSIIPGLPSIGGLLRAADDALGAGKKAGRSPSSKFELDVGLGPVQILQNPSRERLQCALRRSKLKALRRIVDPKTGDVFVWDAWDPAQHRDVARQLGIELPPSAYGEIILLE